MYKNRGLKCRKYNSFQIVLWMSGIYKKEEADSLTSESSDDIFSRYIKRRKEIVPIDLTEPEYNIKVQPKVEMKDQSTQKY